MPDLCATGSCVDDLPGWRQGVGTRKLESGAREPQAKGASMLRITILLLLVSTLFAQEPTRLELKADELPGTSTSWYGLYMAKQKIGWVKEQSARTKNAPGPRRPGASTVAMRT